MMTETMMMGTRGKLITTGNLGNCVNGSETAMDLPAIWFVKQRELNALVFLLLSLIIIITFLL